MEVEVRHTWQSTPHAIENVLSLVFGPAFLIVGMNDIARRELAAGEKIALSVLLVAVPTVALVAIFRRVAAWWRRGRLRAGPDGLTLVDAEGRSETIGMDHLQARSYIVAFEYGDPPDVIERPHVMVEGSSSGQPVSLAGNAWSVGADFWQALGVDPGEPERVNGWRGLERRHPGLRKFGTGDTGAVFIFWMLGCIAWTFLTIGLASLLTP